MTKEEIKTKIITLQKARTRFAISCIFLIAIPFAKKIEKQHEKLRDEIVADLKKYFKEKVDDHYFLNTEQVYKEWIENLKTEEIDTHLGFYNLYGLNNDKEIESLLNEEIIINSIQCCIDSEIDSKKRKIEREKSRKQDELLAKALRDKFENIKSEYSKEDYERITKRINFLIDSLDYMPKELKNLDMLSRHALNLELSLLKDKFEKIPIYTIEENEKLAKQRRINDYGSLRNNGIEHIYINHCWFCGNPIKEIDRKSNYYCPECGHYRCRKCGLCLCGFNRKKL